VNHIHPGVIIGPDVHLGTGNVIGPGTVLLGPMTIGDDNWIGPSVAVGTPGEMRHGAHPRPWDEPMGTGRVVIGDRNVIREFVTVQASETGTTRIGNDCYIMTKAHVPHDGRVEDGVTVSCSVLIGGHSIVQAGVTLGLGTVIHQRSTIGAGAMVGMGSVITKDVPPYAMAYGSPARVKGVNRVGMERSGIASEVIAALDEVYRSSDPSSVEDVPEPLAEVFARYLADVRAQRR
jgi:UDP-N-acetylglucosamine acyltransferase